MNINQTYHTTPAGTLELTLNNGNIIQALFTDNPPQECSDNHIFPIPPLLLQGTAFQIKVWKATQQIPTGATASYKDIAQNIGNSRSWRAVANALNQNKIAYFIPCHRVIQSNGKLGGYRWGIERKKTLLTLERNSI